MKLKKAIKKIVALGADMTMLGASVFGAMAANLNTYPEPFIQDGVFNGIIVVGDSAAASDVIGSVDIATSLQFSASTPAGTGSGGSSVAISGDAVAIGRPGNILEIQEAIGDVRETVTELDLDALKGGLIVTDEGATQYNQFLRFKDSSNALQDIYVTFTENDDARQQVADYLLIDEGNTINDAFFEYEIQFEEGLESAIDTSNQDLKDLEDEQLNILGTVFTVVESDIDTVNDKATLELISGDALDTLEEGETKTYTLNGKDYEVTVIAICDTCNSNEGSVKFSVNGEVTDSLQDGETDVLADGLEIGIRDIMPNEAGDVTQDIVEFFLGASKVELVDTYDDSTYSQGVKIHSESIEDAYVQIKGTELDSKTFEITTIKYRLVADAMAGQNNIYISAGHGVKEYLDEPEGMLSPNWDIRYEGLADTGVSTIRLTPVGDDKYRLEFENQQGQMFNVPFVTNQDGIFKYGSDDDDLWFIEGNISLTSSLTEERIFPISDDDYFVLSDQDSEFDETAYSSVLRYTSIDTSNSQLSFDDLGSGSTRQVTYESISASNLTTGGVPSVLGRAELVIGGNSYYVYVANHSSTYNLGIDLNSDADVNHDEVRLTVHGGGVLDLNGMTNGAHAAEDNASTTSIDNIYNESEARGDLWVTLLSKASEFDENGQNNTGANETLNFYIHTRTNNEVGLNSTIGGLTVYTPEDDDDHRLGLSMYGVSVDLYDPSGSTDAETLTVEYPLLQRGVDVYITAGATKTTRVGGSSEAVTVQRIEVGAAKLASEVRDITAQNAIVVGGPCANAAARELMGVTMDNCAEGFEDGKAMIKLFDNDGQVALLVAGSSAADTRRASRVLANFDTYDLSGMEVEVSGTSLSDISVETVA